jgi:hypothetical protein
MQGNFYAKVGCESASPQQPFQEENERYNQRHKRKRQQQRMNGTGTRAHHFSSAAQECTEQSPQPEKTPRKLRELMKRNAGFMAKVSVMMRIVQLPAKLLFLMLEAQEAASRPNTNS